ncbi:MAG: YjbQ family protein [Proteobacteria bacterium]|nr:YjbQ family protein [Pseudomonadota bacterium]
MIYQEKFIVSTKGRGFYPLEQQIQKIVSEKEVQTGLCHVYIPHTSASIIISENADPTVLKDLEDYMSRLVKDGDPLFQHTAEGEDDMASHIRSVLTQTFVSVPIANHALALGVWQGIFLWEHRHLAHQRQVLVNLLF